MPLSHQLHVEHVVPKVPVPGQIDGDLLAWENMLLACEKCNNAKSNKPSDPTIHYLPESHNGLLPFIAVAHPTEATALIIGIRNDRLTAEQQAKARTTIEAFEWQNVDNRGAIVDIRWMRRYKAMAEVKAAKELLDMAKDSPTYHADYAGKLIATWASSTGFFILWFDVFHDEPEVLKWLIHNDLFKGVAQNCFDASNGYKPIPRNPNNLQDPI